MWNFVKNFPLPLPFPIITGHGTEKVLLMKFEVLGLAIESILRKKVRERLDSEKTKSSLLASIKLLEKHTSECTIPSGLRIQRVRAKGQNADMFQAVFEDIIHDGERKLLDAAIDNLPNYMEAYQEAIQEQEKDIDDTIAPPPKESPLKADQQ